jgi:hypothetical protein
MDKSSSPEVGGTRGSHSPSLRKNRNLDTESIPERELTGNRQLLERAGKVRLWAISQGHRTTYEVVAGDSRWVFNLLFPALGKFDRLSKERRAA